MTDLMELVVKYGNAENRQDDGQAVYFQNLIAAELAKRDAEIAELKKQVVAIGGIAMNSLPRDTENIDRLFLELSQVTRATTAKELALTAERDALRAEIERLTAELERRDSAAEDRRFE